MGNDPFEDFWIGYTGKKTTNKFFSYNEDGWRIIRDLS